MRELAKKQKQEEKKERKLANKLNPQPDENAEALVATEAGAPAEADESPASAEQQ